MVRRRMARMFSVESAMLDDLYEVKERLLQLADGVRRSKPVQDLIDFVERRIDVYNEDY